MGRRLVTRVAAVLVLLPLLLLSSARAATPVAAASGFDTHQGFDSCQVPTQAELQDLWSNTYGFWYGYYLGGLEAAASHCAPWGASLLRDARTIGYGFEPI